jgi:hypothetical protein
MLGMDMIDTNQVYVLLVVEPDYLPDSEVFVFSHVYTPWILYTLEECTLLHTGECRGGYPLQGSGGKHSPTGVWGVRGEAPEGKISL